jgi:hypothetical protein
VDEVFGENYVGHDPTAIFVRCGSLYELANPLYLSWFLFSGLPCVAPYCVSGGVNVVSELLVFALVASSF